MKKLAVAFFISFVAMQMFAIDAFDITATKKTVSSRKSEAQSLPRGESRRTEDHVVYEFQVRLKTTSVHPPLKARWQVLLETAEGQIKAAEQGEKMLDITFGQSVTLTTDEVPLFGREWQGRRNPGTIEDTIAGYGIQILDASGTVLSEKYGPNSIQQYIKWNQQTRQRQKSPTDVPPHFRKRIDLRRKRALEQ